MFGYTRRRLRILALAARNSLRRPSLSTPDLPSTHNCWREIFQDRIYHHPHLQLDDSKRPDVVLDVGANVGVFSAWAAKEYAPRLIFSFEASPMTFEYLNRNVAELNRAFKELFARRA